MVFSPLRVGICLVEPRNCVGYRFLVGGRSFVQPRSGLDVARSATLSDPMGASSIVLIVMTLSAEGRALCCSWSSIDLRNNGSITSRVRRCEKMKNTKNGKNTHTHTHQIKKI